MNLLDLAKGYITNEITEKIGGLLGESPENTSKAVDASLPSIFGGLIGQASTEKGAADLYRQLDDHDGSILDNIGGMLGGGNHTGIADKGNGILNAILGPKLGGVIDLISKVSGMGRGGAGSLLGLLAPIVMGLLGKTRRSQGLDIGGLMDLLNKQKKHVAGALPQGMGSALGLGDMSSWSTDIGDSVSGAASRVGNAVTGTAGAVGDSVSDAAGSVGRGASAAASTVGSAAGSVGSAAGSAGSAAASGGGGLLKLLLPLLLIGALLFFGLRALKGNGDKPVDEGENVPVGVEGEATPGATLPAVTAPEVKAPAVKAPAVKTPAVNAPAVKAPAVKAPAVNAPAVKAPAVKAPAVNAPAVKAPAVKAPAVKAPAVKAPAVKAPAVSLPGVKAPAVKAPGVSLPGVPKLNLPTLNPANAAGELSGLFNNATKTLTGITDLESAKSAVPQISGFTDQLTGMSAGFGKLPGVAQTGVSSALGKLIPGMESQVGRINGIPGVKDVLGNPMESLMNAAKGFIK